MLNILIVEDHPIVVEGIRKIIDESRSSNVIGVAGSGKLCMDFLKWEKPDIIFLDINLPDTSGIQLCREIKKKNPEQKIIALTTFNERSVIKQMMENGANGYILKNSDSKEILEAIEQVNSGKLFLGHEADILLNQASDNKMILSRREKEVLILIAEGFTNSEIAEKLFISPLTVDSHRKNLIIKLKAKNTASLIKIAVENGLI